MNKDNSKIYLLVLLGLSADSIQSVRNGYVPADAARR